VYGSEVFLKMGLGKHFYNHEHDNTINKAKTNQALDIIDFIL
jgi:hypothetical protein